MLTALVMPKVGVRAAPVASEKVALPAVNPERVVPTVSTGLSDTPWVTVIRPAELIVAEPTEVLTDHVQSALKFVT